MAVQLACPRPTGSRQEHLKRVIEGSLQPPDTAMALFVGSLGRNASQVYSKIDKPTLLAVLRCPRTPSCRPTRRDARGPIPGSRIEAFQAGHALFVDEPEKFNQIENFLKK